MRKFGYHSTERVLIKKNTKKKIWVTFADLYDLVHFTSRSYIFYFGAKLNNIWNRCKKITFGIDSKIQKV